jgi:hypothetical protein
LEKENQMEIGMKIENKIESGEALEVKEEQKEQNKFIDIQKIRQEYGLTRGIKDENVPKWLANKEYFEQYTMLTWDSVKDKAKERGTSSATIFKMCCKHIPTLQIIYPCSNCKQMGQIVLDNMREMGHSDISGIYLDKHLCPECFQVWKTEKEDKEKKLAEQRKKRQEKKDARQHWGIYGIVIWDEVVYIGKTLKEFSDRWAEHEACVRGAEPNNSQQNYLYKAMRENEYEFRILIDMANLPEGKYYNNRELECMELTAITLMRPKFNYVGVKVPYKHSGYRGR